MEYVHRFSYTLVVQECRAKVKLEEGEDKPEVIGVVGETDLFNPRGYFFSSAVVTVKLNRMTYHKYVDEH